MSVTELDSKSKYCLNCGSNNLCQFEAYAFDATASTPVSIVECNNCNFAWQFPLGRTENQSVEFFETAYADKGRENSNYFDEKEKREISLLEYQFVASLPVQGKKLLDIGAGAGIFAEVAAENGWCVTATDPALDTSRFKKNKSITAIKGMIDEVPEGELFDLITLWDVIEHATAPMALIDSAARHLRDGGWLVMETGNYRSAERVAGGKGHWIYQLDHRWYFSPESLENSLKKFGFSDFVHSKRVLRPGWDGDLNYPGPSRAQLISAILREPSNIRMHLVKYYQLLDARRWKNSGLDIFTIAARKR